MTTVKELKATCKKLGIKKYSAMKKSELEQAIKKHTKHESQKDLEKKPKKKTMYQKVKDFLVGPELSKQIEQENESKHTKEFRKKVNNALTSKKISSANVNKIEKFYRWCAPIPPVLWSGDLDLVSRLATVQSREFSMRNSQSILPKWTLGPK